jgi:pantothenate kinase
MITSKHEVLEKRLVERWRSFNISEEEIKQKVYENDLPNGVNVYKNSIQANYKLLN